MASKKSTRKVKAKTNSRGRKVPTSAQLSRDRGKLYQRTVRRSDGSAHRQGVMYGTKYGDRHGVARIGGKQVAYSSRRR